MNKVIGIQTPTARGRVWIVVKRVLAIIVILITAIGFLANAAGLVGIWVVRRPACDAVTAVSTFVNRKLGIVEQAQTRVSARADDARQAVARVKNAVNNLGDHPEESSPLLGALASAAGDDLAPKIVDAREQAAAIHDGVVSVNTVLETLDTLRFIKVPTFTDELNAVSKRVDAAQTDVQELRATIAEARTAASANLVAAMTARTIKIDNGLAQIKSTAVKYHATVAEKQQQLTNLSHTVLRVINLLVLSLTALLLVMAGAQVLLIYVCWQCVRTGRFPLLRIGLITQ